MEAEGGDDFFKLSTPEPEGVKGRLKSERDDKDSEQEDLRHKVPYQQEDPDISDDEELEIGDVKDIKNKSIAEDVGNDDSDTADDDNDSNYNPTDGSDDDNTAEKSNYGRKKDKSPDVIVLDSDDESEDGLEGALPEPILPTSRTEPIDKPVNESLNTWEHEKTGFPVQVELDIKLEGLEHLSKTFTIQSEDRFRQLRRLLLEYLETMGVRDSEAVKNAFFAGQNFRVFDSSSPKALEVSPQDPRLELLILSEEQFQQMEQQYRQSFTQSIDRDSGYDNGNGYDTENENETYNNGNDDNDGDDDDDSEVFAVQMLGSDGNKVHVRVSADTVLEKLYDYYCNKKSLAKGSIGLYVDGDLLAPQSTIGDADLEEGDTIDVHTT